MLSRGIPLLPNNTLGSNKYINSDLNTMLHDENERVSILVTSHDVTIHMVRRHCESYNARIKIPLSVIKIKGLIGALQSFNDKNHDTLSKIEMDLIKNMIFYFKLHYVLR